MIKLLHVDDRLLHGQVGVFWVNATGSNAILVANDKYGNNEMLAKSLKMGKPPGTALEILPVEKALAYLNDTANEGKKIFVIVENMQDALAVCENGNVPEVNLGGVRKGEGTVRISIRTHLNKEGFEICKKLHDMRLPISCRETPMSKQVSYNEIVKIYTKTAKE